MISICCDDAARGREGVGWGGGEGNGKMRACWDAAG